MPAKNKTNQNSLSQGLFLFLGEKNEERAKEFLDKTGDALEEQFSKSIEGSRREAPVLTGEPYDFIWYRMPLTDGLSGDGSEYHIYLRKGNSSNLCIFLSGGGLAWNAYTAAHPITYGKIASWQPNYYYSNLRPSTQLMNIGSGIMENSTRNPFYDWNFIVITYATGDFHIGNNIYPYKDEDGSEKVLHFHGHRNFQEAMKACSYYFSKPLKLLIGGDSAGGFAVPALAGEIVSRWYPDCEKVYLLSDASLLCYTGWKHTIKDLWKADPSRYECIETENLTLDWYKTLLRKYPRRFQCLYCGSTHDYLLSTYYNDVTNKQYDTDQEVQNAFYGQLKAMVSALQEQDHDFAFFLHRFKTPFTHGGTVHTAVRRSWFHAHANGTTIALWLSDAVNGNIRSYGLDLL